MTDTHFPNQIRAYDRVDEFDDVLHYIHEFPKTVPASEIRAQPGQTAVDYVWEDHMDINPTTGEVSVDRLPNMELRPADGIAHVFPFVVAATDGLNITLQEATFLVNHAIEKPVWGTQTTEFTRVEGSAFSAQFSAFDPEQGNMVYTVSGLPGFTMSADGVLTGTVPANATQIVQDYPFTVSAKSSTSGEVSDLPCVLHVTNNNRAPSWTSSSVFSVSPGPWTTVLSATDREGDGPITFEIIGAANGFVLTGSTLSRTNPDVTANYSVTLRAYSGEGTRRLGTDQTITVKVTEIPNDPPVWVTPVGPIGTAEGGSAFDFQLRATDTELVTYQVTSGALPAGLTMSVTGRITGTLPTVAQGTTQFAFTVTASDGENFVPRSFSIAVTRTNNPPAWSTPAGLLLDLWAGQPFDIQLAASDPEGVALNYTISKPSSLNWLSMSQTGRITGRVPLTAQATTSNILFTVTISDGVHTVPREFQIRVKTLAPQTIGFTKSDEWIVPEGVYQIMFTWVVGAGGGGGAGHELGNGGGGAGGGTGGFVRYTAMDVVPGDKIVMDIGAGGIGFSGCCGVMGYGGNGGGTRVLKNNAVQIQVEGGKGGGTSPNFSGGYLASVPGQGGSPNGLPGKAGQTGSNDRASSTGGPGEHGPLIGAVGGSGGQAGGGSNYTTGPGAGKSGIGPGSSGGGGGSQDRVNSSRQYWKGGNGNGGYVEFTFPSQGPVGGTAPWEPTPVNTANYLTFYGPAAGPGSQADYYTDQPNLSYNVGSGGGQVSSVVVHGGSGIWEVWTGSNYSGQMITVDGTNVEYHIGSFKGISRVGSARRQGSTGGSNTGGGSGGGGGGSVGGSCAWVEAILPSGKVVGDTQVGDDLLLLNKEGDGYFHHPVTGVRFDSQQCYTIVTESGIELTVSDTTPIVIKTADGYEVVRNFVDSILMERVPVLDHGEFRWELVVELKDAGVLPVGLISADNGIYASGNQSDRYIFTHNVQKEINDQLTML